MWRDTLHTYGNALTDRAAVVPAEILGSAVRFGGYRTNIEFGLRNALAETYPIVKRLVGDDFFDAMALAYIQENRPASPVLHEYGASFGSFIETYEPVASLPYLADVARFERVWLDAYHAADCAFLQIDTLAEIAAQELDNLRFRFHPSFNLLQSPFPMVSIWRAHQDDNEPDLSSIFHTTEQAVIIRPELDVHVHSVSSSAYRFFTSLAVGGTLGDVCEALADADGFDPSAHLATLFEMGAITALNREAA